MPFKYFKTTDKFVINYGKAQIIADAVLHNGSTVWPGDVLVFQRTDSCPTAFNKWSFQQTRVSILSGVKFIWGSGILPFSVSLGTDLTRIFFILRISVSFYFCGFLKKKNNNLFCAYYYVATVKKAQGMTHCHLNTSFAFLPPHFGSCPSPHDALAASGLPRKATCLQASAPLWRLPFPGQCCLSPLSSCSPCSPHCLPNTRTTWCIFSGMDKHLLYPISENRL